MSGKASPFRTRTFALLLTLGVSLAAAQAQDAKPSVSLIAAINLKVPGTVAEQTIALNHRATAIVAGGKKLDALVSEKAEMKVEKEKPKPRAGGHQHEM